MAGTRLRLSSARWAVSSIALVLSAILLAQALPCWLLHLRRAVGVRLYDCLGLQDRVRTSAISRPAPSASSPGEDSTREVAICRSGTLQ